MVDFLLLVCVVFFDFENVSVSVRLNFWLRIGYLSTYAVGIKFCFGCVAFWLCDLVMAERMWNY